MTERNRRRLVAHGALAYLVGLLAGFPFAFVELQRIELWPLPGSIPVTLPGDVRAWRMAHLEGILNGLTCIGVAAVGPLLRLSPRAEAVVTWGLVVTVWGNVVASLLGPITGGRGLAFGGGVGDDVMYLLFVAAVVGVLAAVWLVFRGAVARDRAPAPMRTRTPAQM